MKTYFLMFWWCAIGFAVGGEPVKIDVDEAVTWLDKTAEVQRVDVRSAEEYAEGHLKGAMLVTWGEKDFEKQALAQLAKDKPVLVYCRSGRRSTAAAEVLAKLGFDVIRNLEGGIIAWQKAGKPVVK